MGEGNKQTMTNTIQGMSRLSRCFWFINDTIRRQSSLMPFKPGVQTDKELWLPEQLISNIIMLAY